MQDVQEWQQKMQDWHVRASAVTALGAWRVRAAEVLRNFTYTDSHGNVHLVTQGGHGQWTDNQIIEHAPGQGWEGVTHFHAKASGRQGGLKGEGAAKALPPRKTPEQKAADHAAQIQQALEDWRSGKAYYSNGNYRLHTEPSQLPTSKWGGRSIPAPWNAAAKREFPSVDDLSKASRLPSYVPKAISAKAARDIKAAAAENEQQRRAVQLAIDLSPTMKALSEGKVVLTHTVTEQGSVRMLIVPIMHPDGTFDVQTYTSRSVKDGSGNYTPHVTWPDYRFAKLITANLNEAKPYPLTGTYKSVKSGMRALLAAEKPPAPRTSATKISGAKATSGGKTSGAGKAKQSDLYDTALNVTLPQLQEGQTIKGAKIKGIYASPTLPFFLDKIRNNPRSRIGDGAVLAPEPKDVSKIFATVGNIEKDRELQAAEQARRDANPIYKDLMERGETSYYNIHGTSLENASITIRRRYDMQHRFPVYDVFLGGSKRPAKGFANLLWTQDRVFNFIQSTGGQNLRTDRAAAPDLVTLTAESAVLRMRVATILHQGATP